MTTVAAPPPVVKTSSRLDEMVRTANGLNAARVTAAVLVVLLHAAASYIVSPFPMWILLDTSRHVTVDVLVIGINGFVMPLFFLLAGMSVAKAAWQTPFREFAVLRGKRLGATFLLGLAIILPPTLACLGLGLLWTERMSMNHLARLKLPNELYQFGGPGHLWFVEYLLLLSVGWSAVARLSQRWPSTARWAQGAWSHTLLSSWWGPLVFALPTFVIFACDAATPFRLVTPFVPDVARMLHYSVFFIAGVWLAGAPQSSAGLRANAPWHLLVAATTFVGLCPLTLGYFEQSLSLPERWALVGFQAVFAWSMVFGFLGGMLRWCSARRESIRYANEASFWLYLAHLPVVFAMQLVVWQWELSPWVKLLIVAVTATAIPLVSYEFCVRYSWLGAVINGTRKEHPTTRGLRLEAGWLSLVAVGMLLLAAFIGFGWDPLLGTNVHTVVAGRIYRSNRLTLEQLEEVISRCQIRSVVSLAPGDAVDAWFRHQMEVCDRRGIPLAALAFNEFQVPSSAEIEELQLALQHTPRPVLIIGGNRSPTLSGFGAAVAILVDEGSPEEALAQLGLRYFQLEGPEHCIVAQPLREYRAWLAAGGVSHSAAAFLQWTQREQATREELAAAKARQPAWQAMTGAPRFPKRF